MHLYTKDLAKIGFKHSGLFDCSKIHHFYYAKVPSTRKIYVIDNFDQSLSHFCLTKKQWTEFPKGRLSLIPIGCCCATGNKYIENPLLDFKGDFKANFKTRSKTMEFIKSTMEKK
jgi:hypothetical protein